MKASLGIVLTGALGLVMPAVPARAQAPSTASPGDKTVLARQLFAQGRIAYDLGNYDDAISRFQSAYEQLQEPAFLFNIAQAYRLKNDCLRATAGYRRFLRLSKHAETRAAAEAHLADLDHTCPLASVAVPSPGVLPRVSLNSLSQEPKAVTQLVPTNDSRRPSQPSPATHAFSMAALAGGSAMGAVALGLTVWNVRRHNEWSTENDLLAQSNRGGDPLELIERQNANDDRLRSIERTEKAGWGFAIGAAVLLVTGVVLKLVETKP